MPANNSHTAELQYSKEYNRLELIVPHGTKITELSKIIESIGRGKFGSLPRGCSTCTSGDHFVIRERLQSVINVELASGTAIGQ